MCRIVHKTTSICETSEPIGRCNYDVRSFAAEFCELFCSSLKIFLIIGLLWTTGSKSQRTSLKVYCLVIY